MKKTIIISTLTFFLGMLTIQSFNYFLKADTTPDSGSTSRLRELYDSLVTLDHGDESGDWGTIWNRIKSAAEWTPNGDVTADDVKSGITFYSDSRTAETGTLSLVGDANLDEVVSGKTFYADDFTLQTGTLSLVGDATVDDVVSGKTFYGSSFDLLTGTAPAPVDYSLMQYSERDDYAGTYYTGLGPEDYQLEESTWTSPATNVWKDERTGVYWGPDRGVLTTNNFTAISLNNCDYFDETLYEKRGDYPGVSGSENIDADCGNAINYCATLDFGDRTDWYLPSQKELMQAYIDGMYNQAGATPVDAAAFTYGTTGGGGYVFWSSSEASNLPTYAWRMTFFWGQTLGGIKTGTQAVRCVARD